MVKLLLENGANPYIQNNNNGETAFHLAIEKKWNNEIYYSSQIKKSSKKIVKLFFEYSIDIDHKNKYGNTSLYIATNNSDKKTIKLLLENGANPNIKDNFGETILHLAIENNNNNNK